MAEDFTHQRIYTKTQEKLQKIAGIYKPRVTVPALLEALADTEYARHPELTASDLNTPEAQKGGKND